MSLTAAVAYPGTSLYTVSGGKVKIISFFARVMTTIGGGAVTIQPLATRTGGGIGEAYAFSLVSGSLAAGAAGAYLSFGDPANVPFASLGSAILVASVQVPTVVEPGTIGVEILVGDGGTGTLDFFIEWYPLEQGAKLVAA
jgi:hypothetical protein